MFEKVVEFVESVPKLRELISDEQNAMLEDKICIRFLTSRKGNMQSTLKLVNDWYSWRNSEIQGVVV
jgi:hypothetical protein